MAHGKEAARDLRYGRRGGRWANNTPVDAALAAIDMARSRGLSSGTWPDGVAHGKTPCKICGRAYVDHLPACPLCGRAPEHHGPGDLELERTGRARMAAARRAVGQSLDDIDRQVLAEQAAA